MALTPTVGDWDSGDPFRVARAARVTVSQFRERAATLPGDGAQSALDFANMFEATADALAALLDRHVTGSCPMCGGPLHLTVDGTIECLADDCENDTAVSALLADTEREHIVRIEDDRFHVKHPLRERVNDGMLSCLVHTELSDMDEPPASTGVYRVTRDEHGHLHFEATEVHA